MVKLSVQLGILSAINIFILFFFQWYVLTYFGPGVETDALFAGMAVPQLVLTVVSTSLMHVLVPLLSGENKYQLRHDIWAFLTLIIISFGGLAIFLYVTASFWVPLTVPGFSEGGQSLTIKLTRIQLIGMVFTAINGVQWAAYHSRQQFLWAELTPALASVFSFFLLLWALPQFGVVAAAWISTLRTGLQTVLLAPGMGRPLRPDLKSVAIQKAWRRIKPLLLGTVYYKTDPLVDRFLLSTTSSGNLSLYYFAQQIYSAANQILNKAISAPLVPTLSILYKAGDKVGFRNIFYQKLLHIGTMSLVTLTTLALFGKYWLHLLVGYGSINASNVDDLWRIMLWLSGMFVGGLLGQITSSAFYSIGDTRIITLLSMFSYTIYIPFKVASFYLWGIFGLASTTTIYFMANLSIQIYLLRKKYLV